LHGFGYAVVVTKRQYISFLIATEGNFTATHLAEHLTGEQAASHDSVTDYLAREKITPRQLWELVKHRVNDSHTAFLIVDDSIQNKNYSRHIGLVHKQFSGNEHRVIRGIGVVTLLHSDGQEFWPLDYRVFDPDGDGKTKHDHFREMLVQAKADKQIQARMVLFDSWYTSCETLKLIARLGMVFVAPLKSNRRVSVSKEAGYTSVDELTWTNEQLRFGQSIKLKELPFRVRLFKVVSCTGDIDWLITNRPGADESEGQGSVEAKTIQNENRVRWQIEQLHRELKQLVGSERCQCRKARSQRNHLGCCYQAWVALRVKAKATGKTLYQIRRSLFNDYLRAELQNPRIPALN
jgi:hypothetical protein